MLQVKGNLKIKLTMDVFETLPNGEIFATGMTPDSPTGLNMTGRAGDRVLRWVAVKGWCDDWAVYCGWATEMTDHMVSRNGDKVQDMANIKNIIDADDEVVAWYRH